jgi:hypothetical protein
MLGPALDVVSRSQKDSLAQFVHVAFNSARGRINLDVAWAPEKLKQLWREVVDMAAKAAMPPCSNVHVKLYASRPCPARV